MSGIFIPNMEMPTSCADCKLRMVIGCCGNLPHNTRMPNCPLDPATDVEPVRHGRWLIKTIRGDKRTVCSECLIETGTCYEENYCPNCGAKMDKDGDGE